MAGHPSVVGYVDPWVVAPGDEISLMVSSTAREYDVQLVRLIHGAQDPAGPGERYEVVREDLGPLPGRVQRVPSGSYLRAAIGRTLDVASFTVTAWIWPTTPAAGRPQALVSRRLGGTGWAVGLDGAGKLAAWIGDAEEPVAVTETPIPAQRWTFVAAAFDADGQVTLCQVPVQEWPVDSWRSTVRAAAPAVSHPDADLLVAAWWRTEAAAEGADEAGSAPAAEPRIVAAAHYNGKIDSPTVLAGAADATRLASAHPMLLGLDVLAAWRPGADAGGVLVPDRGPSGLHAHAVNTPARGVTGRNWRGREVDFKRAPDEYDALHFHDDDMTDAQWSPDLSLRLPVDLRSGVYGFRLSAGTDTYTVAFFVRPPRGVATNQVAVLIPTMTYLAYANVHMVTESGGKAAASVDLTPAHQWAADQSLCSLYDVHRDGSGVFYSSRRRPLITLTPEFIDPFIDELWNLSADLCLIDWLEHESIGYDVITDEDLHTEGADLLDRYPVVLTGTHPEYYTEAMLDAHESYLAGGGRVMYLGGNGYYWVTGVSAQEPHVVEIRRGHAGTRTWEAAPGETYLSTTGEPGGLWRHRGRAPQRHVGVGFASQGGGVGRGYDQTKFPDGSSEARRGAFALAGVEGLIDADGLIGHAAAGAEIDRADDALGTPPHTVVLASATGFSDNYQHAIEEVLVANSLQGGSVEPRVRADLVFLEYPHGGAVFATGSIGWSTCLAAEDYGNPVARVTANVLHRFLDPAPFPTQG
jgi:N,N-dimethylformamidase